MALQRVQFTLSEQGLNLLKRVCQNLKRLLLAAGVVYCLEGRLQPVDTCNTGKAATGGCCLCGSAVFFFAAPAWSLSRPGSF